MIIRCFELSFSRHILDPIGRLQQMVNSPLVIFAILGFFNSDLMLVDLFGTFLIQTISIALVGTLWFLARKQWLPFSMCALLLTLKLYVLFPYINIPEKKEAKDSATLHVIASNVYGRNDKYQEVLHSLKSNSPEILAISEVNSAWNEQLKSLAIDYPYSEVITREDNFGMALYSKFPLFDVQLNALAYDQPPIIKASITWEGQKLNLVLVHTLPPATQRNFKLRNQELELLARQIKESKEETIVLGDLNVAPWSKHLQKLLADGQLNDPRENFGILPTWTQDFFPLLIPIDYVLTTKSLAIFNLKTHETPGSDHRALEAEISRL